MKSFICTMPLEADGGGFMPRVCTGTSPSREAIVVVSPREGGRDPVRCLGALGEAGGRAHA